MRPDEDTTHWTVVPAQPGYKILEPIAGGSTGKVAGLEETSIVAWIVPYKPQVMTGDTMSGGGRGQKRRMLCHPRPFTDGFANPA